jgi:DNA-binding transcriptional ArsR family regulator
MVLKYTTELYQLKAQLCKTFSDPIRLMVIQELREGEKTVGTLQSVLGIPQAGVSRHLAILCDKGMVSTRRESTNIFYRLANPKICEACDIIHEILIKQIESGRELAQKFTGK